MIVQSNQTQYSGGSKGVCGWGSRVSGENVIGFARDRSVEDTQKSSIDEYLSSPEAKIKSNSARR